MATALGIPPSVWQRRHPAHFLCHPMCGIAGVITRSREQAAHALAGMVTALTHRGPDDEGVYLARSGEAAIALGHRRLAIIDRSPAGRQPMTCPRTGCVLAFNGEIYNFRELRTQLQSHGVVFRTRTDTEVLLHSLVRWGVEALPRLEGMFALAFHDPRHAALLLARDHAGIKPLYVASTDEGLLFASEVRSIMASGMVPLRYDPATIASYLAFGAPQEPYTAIDGVRMLPAGSWTQFNLRRGGPRQWANATTGKFWSLPESRSAQSQAVAVEEVRQAMDAAVRSHLVSDAPLGVFLSSGLDSTIVASLAAKHISGLRTFTVDIAGRPELSESEPARRTANRIGAEHTRVELSDDDALKLTIDWLLAMDQPSIDGLNVFVISRAAKRKGLSVALSGQGGDELFGGYPSFRDVPRLAILCRWMAHAPAWSRELAVRGLTARRSGNSEAVREKLRDILRSGGDLTSIYLHRRRAMSDGQLAALGARPGESGLDERFTPPHTVMPEWIDSTDPVATISRLETALYMRNMLLRDGDACSMAHALEVRVPFLDRRVMELAHSLPGRVRLPDGRANKHLLRQAFADLLPAEITNGPKRGFVLPIGRWLKGPLRDMAATALENLRGSGLVQASGVDSVWQAFDRAPDSPAWSRAWALVVLGVYTSRKPQAIAPVQAPEHRALVKRIMHEEAPTAAPASV